MAQRTLVKSPPELWAEVSDVATLARHLGEFGDIRITRLEAETTVAWEGDTARGTVELAPSGWGTTVTLRAEAVAPEPPAEPVAERRPERRWWALRPWRRRPVAAVAPPVAPPPTLDAGAVEAVLAGVLDDLGAAHHRPFSRG
jgi:hypothetical protein